MSLWHTIDNQNMREERKDSMDMKRLYLVTGAYGHLGHTIVDELLARGEEVRGLALPGDSIPAPVRRGLEICQGDVCDPDSLVAFFHVDEPREIVVIHTAGIVSIASKFNQKVFDVNVVGTKNIVDICRKSNVRRLVHVSSVHAIPEKARGETVTEVSRFDYRKVEGLYAQTKAKATQIVLNAAAGGLDAVVVHPSGILGPGDYGHGHLTQLVTDYLNGRLTACVKGGYDFVDVRDVATAACIAAAGDAAGVVAGADVYLTGVAAADAASPLLAADVAGVVAGADGDHGAAAVVRQRDGASGRNLLQNPQAAAALYAVFPLHPDGKRAVQPRKGGQGAGLHDTGYAGNAAAQPQEKFGKFKPGQTLGRHQRKFCQLFQIGSLRSQPNRAGGPERPSALSVI